MTYQYLLGKVSTEDTVFTPRQRIEYQYLLGKVSTQISSDVGVLQSCINIY